MSYNIDPYDIMQYHNRLLELYEPYAGDLDNRNSLAAQIEKSGEVINRFFREGVLDYTYPIMHIAVIGKATERINDFHVVDPDGNPRDKSAKEIYPKKLFLEHNPWKTVYELEVAQSCASVGIETKLVHEGQKPGPDLFAYCADNRVDIECKRRDPYDSDGDYGYKMIQEEINDGIEIEEDSFFLEITANGPIQDQAIEKIIELGVKVIEDRKPSASCEVDDIEYTANLKDYFIGEKDLDISKQDLKRWFANDIISPHTIKRFLSPFDEKAISPGSYISSQFKFTEEGETVTKDNKIVDFNIPEIDDKYYDRIVNTTLHSGREDLKNRSPAVLFLHLPANSTDDLKRYYVQEGDYEPTPQIKRLEQRVEGELNDSSSLNAVVLTNTFFDTDNNNCRIDYGYKFFENPSPKYPLPEEFQNYISGELF